jgi:hypothetical protein
LRRHLLSYCEPPQARSRRSLLARTVAHSSSQRASRASACLHLRKHLLKEHQEHQRRHPTTFLSMTCCAYETTGIARPLVRYLPPQKLSPPLLTHSPTGSSSRGAKLCDLITDRNRPRYGGIGDDHPRSRTASWRPRCSGPLRLTASREAKVTLPQYPALGGEVFPLMCNRDWIPFGRSSTSSTSTIFN